MTVAVLAAAGLQVVAGVVRVRGWFHCVRASSAACRGVRFRDVVVSHLAGTGWNGLPVGRWGEAVKVALLQRRVPSAPIGTVAGTVLPLALIEASLTAISMSALLLTGSISPARMVRHLPATGRVPLLATCSAIALAAGYLLWRRAPRLIRDFRAGLGSLRRPGLLLTRVVPWHLAARALRLVALAVLLSTAGLPVAAGTTLLLMILQGASPSVGPTSAAVRFGIVTAALPAGHAGTQLAHAVRLVIGATLVTSAVSLVVSLVTVAIVLRTASPRRIVGRLLRGPLRGLRRRTAAIAAISTLAAVLAFAGAGLAATDNVPTVSHLTASPDRFCVKHSRRCRRPGTRLSFRVSTAAKVRGDIRPRNANLAPYPEFDRSFPRGENSVHFNDRRLYRGRWTFRIQGMNRVGSGGIALVDVHVVRHT